MLPHLKVCTHLLKICICQWLLLSLHETLLCLPSNNQRKTYQGWRGCSLKLNLLSNTMYPINCIQMKFWFSVSQSTMLFFLISFLFCSLLSLVTLLGCYIEESLTSRQWCAVINNSGMIEYVSNIIVTDITNGYIDQCIWSFMSWYHYTINHKSYIVSVWL